MTRIAICCCGQTSVTCTGDPVGVGQCHCQACQRRTGSAFGLAAFYPRDAVAVSGTFNEYERTADSGHRVRFHFCGRCGSTLYWEPSRKPDMIAVAAGAFADPGFPAPESSHHTEHRHDWLRT